MALEPTLIIQLQRMGDLIMTFPLMAWLRIMEPERPVWVVAEPMFFKALLPFAPKVVFFRPEAAPVLARRRFHRVINLSHRKAGLSLAGKVETGLRVGAFGRDGDRHIVGPWQLYRASIVHNNRHNRLHWADLAALDSIPPGYLPLTHWPRPRKPGAEGRIGLFVGASEADKHPDAAFWAALAIQLIRRGLNPVFLGGKAERALAAQAARKAGIPKSNLAAHFNLEKFAQFIGRLDLLVTPDTGPMHLGAWLGTPTLNLSMGPVNPWETAPATPGHFVLRAEPSCAGCWQCVRLRSHGVPPCHAAFSPKRTSALIQAILLGQAHKMALPGLRLMRTARDARGLFVLEAMDQHALRLRDRIGDFWREAFLAMLGGPEPRLAESVIALREAEPRIPALLTRYMSVLMRHLALRGQQDFWLAVPPLLRPFSSYAQMVWDNRDRGPAARREITALAEVLLESLNAG